MLMRKAAGRVTKDREPCSKRPSFTMQKTAFRNTLSNRPLHAFTEASSAMAVNSDNGCAR